MKANKTQLKKKSLMLVTGVSVKFVLEVSRSVRKQAQTKIIYTLRSIILCVCVPIASINLEV